MASEAQIRASKRYNKENTMMLSIRFNLKLDADIIEYLEKAESKTGLIKKLIREEIKKGEQ